MRSLSAACSCLSSAAFFLNTPSTSPFKCTAILRTTSGQWAKWRSLTVVAAEVQLAAAMQDRSRYSKNGRTVNFGGLW
jgi:uridine phosphorylase